MAMSMNYNKITDIMSLKHFLTVQRYLHFSDNSLAENSLDRVLKIRPVIDAVVNKYRKLHKKKSSL